MKVEELRNEGLARALRVTLAGEQLDAQADAKLLEEGQKLRLKGFRPGKIPLSVLRQRFRGSVLRDVLNEAVESSVRDLLKERDETPALQPKVEPDAAYEGSGDFSFSVTYDLLPSIELVDLSDLKLTQPDIEVSDEKLQEALEAIAEQHSGSAKIARNRKAREGDIVLLDFDGTVDGERREGMKAEDFKLELGSGQFIPGFEPQLIGVKGGEAVEVTVTFPDDYNAEDLKGKEAVFAVSLKEIHEKTLPALDDDLAKKAGMEDFESLHKETRSKLELEYKSLTRALLKRRLLDALDARYSFDLPSSMVEQEFGGIWRQIEQDREQGRLDADDQEKDEETLRQDYQQIAQRRVRLGLVLAEVSNQQKFEVTDQEMSQLLMREAMKYPGHEQQVVEYFRQNPSAALQLRGPALEEKAVDWILAQVQVENQTMTLDELEAALNEV